MTAASYTLQMVLLTFSGWVSLHQQDVIECLIDEPTLGRGEKGGEWGVWTASTSAG